jgi:hypothetical protein
MLIILHQQQLLQVKWASHKWYISFYASSWQSDILSHLFVAGVYYQHVSFMCKKAPAGVIVSF